MMRDMNKVYMMAKLEQQPSRYKDLPKLEIGSSGQVRSSMSSYLGAKEDQYDSY